jgi:2,3-bisphosphoglycerate-independent phosphoglycerate mutase
MTAPAHRPVVLMILDGWGLSDNPEGNAPYLANTPNFDRIWRDCPHATLSASGEDVGLPAGQMGNSEVGHTNIGAGRVVWMDLPRIDKALADGSLAANPALDRFAAALQQTGGTAHVMGLMSPGGARRAGRAASVP